MKLVTGVIQPHRLDDVGEADVRVRADETNQGQIQLARRHAVTSPTNTTKQTSQTSAVMPHRHRRER